MGFLAALTFNVWMVVGNFVTGGGSPARLPLSVAGCASPMNATLDVLASTTLDSTTVDQTEKSLYNISYCFNSLIGIGIAMLVSNVAMLAGVKGWRETWTRRRERHLFLNASAHLPDQSRLNESCCVGAGRHVSRHQAQTVAVGSWAS
ncbi:hypothetical protein GWK47_042858 [Chionoecetes opilio]|uniref:Uncharacterized protein n=1 Tax=Chionoecetes opilio TaxID=41210 RepID=A0A8J4Y8R7_CHIOP|nr:hypothetical protein GWK47_042858 [Chionoecetes opilio]